MGVLVTPEVNSFFCQLPLDGKRYLLLCLKDMPKC